MEQPVKTVVAEVMAVIPEYRQTICNANGYQYAVTRRALGPSWDSLKEGDIVTLEVYIAQPIVKKVINVNPR